MNEELKALAYALRKNVLDMVYRAKTGHIGGDFSVMEILTSLYMKEMNISPENQDDPDRDYFVMSKGHSVEAYYSVLAAKGFLDIGDVIQNFSKFGSGYIGHPNNKLPGIEMNSGSLGHGLPVCVGIAKACRMDARPSRVYTVMGDGELAEGSVWEGVMAASQYKLDNLCAVVDRNRLQISTQVSKNCPSMAPRSITSALLHLVRWEHNPVSRKYILGALMTRFRALLENAGINATRPEETNMDIHCFTVGAETPTSPAKAS